MTLHAAELFRAPASADGANADSHAATEAVLVTLEEFVAIDEPGADALLGDSDSALIPEGGDVMLYGDGGAGKTTLTIDLAFHLAAGEPWLEIPIARPVGVLIIEGEGPRPLFRKKLRRKHEGWRGGALNGRVSVFAEPWAQFTFAAEQWRAQLAAAVREREIDVVVAGPITRIGMDGAGTLQEVVRFMELVAEVRRQCGRLLTVILVHHENKGGAVSGAWEGAGDTLLHVQGAGRGHTVVFVQKARWDSERHGTTLKLAWTEGEGFRVEGERDLRAEIVALLSDGVWRTAKEISSPRKRGGVAANVDTVKALLKERGDTFESRTGAEAVALGRDQKATLWGLAHGSESVESVSDFSGGDARTDSLTRPLGESAVPAHPASITSGLTWSSESVPQPADDPADKGQP